MSKIGELYFGEALMKACLLLEEIASDPQVERRFQRTSKLLTGLTEALDSELSEIDAKLCGESTREDDVLDMGLESGIREALAEVEAELGPAPADPEPGEDVDEG